MYIWVEASPEGGGERGERDVGEGGHGGSISLSLQTRHTLCRVPDIKHRYTAIQSSIHIVGIVHIPGTCPDWTWGLVSVHTTNKHSCITVFMPKKQVLKASVKMFENTLVKKMTLREDIGVAV